jgi:hypothetical protein
MRVSTEIILLALVSALAGWAARAPEEPLARAHYYCRPLVAAAQVAGRFEAALRDGGQIIPPTTAWRFDVQRDCARVMVRLTDDVADPEEGAR